jgi:hypothetical protein
MAPACRAAAADAAAWNTEGTGEQRDVVACAHHVTPLLCSLGEQRVLLLLLQGLALLVPPSSAIASLTAAAASTAAAAGFALHAICHQPMLVCLLS